MVPSELALVPWPALLVSANGAVIATSPAAVALLGMTPSDIAALEDRFELLSTSGQPVASEDASVAPGSSRRAVPGRRYLARPRVWARAVAPIPGSSRRAVRPPGDRLARSRMPSGARPSGCRNSTRHCSAGRPAKASSRYGNCCCSSCCKLARSPGHGTERSGCCTPDGESLKDFIYVGVPEDTAKAIGHLPVGKGLLGAVISEGRTIRVPHIARRSPVGRLPPSHPPMTSFLGVPLRVGAAGLRELLPDRQAGRQRVHGRRRTSPRAVQRASVTHGRIRTPGGAGGAKALRDRRAARAARDRLLPGRFQRRGARKSRG